MRFLSMVKLTEGKSSPPSKAMIDAVNQLVQEVAKEGCVMVQSGGLYPTSAGARVRLAGSKITVTDGTESASDDDPLEDTRVTLRRSRYEFVSVVGHWSDVLH